jgi:hypothetical protein
MATRRLTHNPLILSQLHIRRASRADYTRLATRSHLSPSIPPPLGIFALSPRRGTVTPFPPILALVAYTSPLANCGAREKLFAPLLSHLTNPSAKLRFINRHFVYLARAITDNRFLHMGLCHYLLRRTLDRFPTRILESTFAADFRLPLMRQLGFTCIHRPIHPHLRRFKHALQRFNIHADLLPHPRLVHQRIESLDPAARDLARHHFDQFASHLRIKTHLPHSPQRTAYLLTHISAPSVYAFRIHPDHPIAPAFSNQQRGDPHHTQHPTNLECVL